MDTSWLLSSWADALELVNRLSRAFLGLLPPDRLDAGDRGELRAQVLERDVTIDRQLVLDDRLLALRDIARLVDDALAREHAFDRDRRELAAVGFQLEHELTRLAIRRETIEQHEEQAQESRSEAGDRKRAQSRRH